MSARGGGLFVVLEGGEGVGKTTQWGRLTSALEARGVDVVALREPGGTPAGDALRAVLLDPTTRLVPEAEALLFAASRAQLVRDVIRPALARGATVLADRFLLSTFAYQGAGRGLALPDLAAVNALATGGLVPDLTMLLHLPVHEALARARARSAADRMELESAAFHARVHAALLDASSEAWQARHPEVGPVLVVDGHGSEDAVTARCLGVLAARWPVRFGTGPAVRPLDSVVTPPHA